MSRLTKFGGNKIAAHDGKIWCNTVKFTTAFPLSVFSTAWYEITEEIGYESRQTLVREKKVLQFNIWSSLTVHNLLLVQCSP